MRQTIAIVVLALSLTPSIAAAGERATDAALGAVSGAVVFGPIGAVAGAVVGYTAGPSISHSWGVRRSSRQREARRASSPEARASTGENQPAPGDQAAAASSAPQPAPPRTASTAPPVQPLE
jgi:hypothetical protein